MHCLHIYFPLSFRGYLANFRTNSTHCLNIDYAGRYFLLLLAETLNNISGPGVIHQTLDIAGGQLTFEGVRRWHGFLIDYDPTRPYLLIFILVAIGGISWHYIQVTRRTET